jgi:spermidine synthase
VTIFFFFFFLSGFCSLVYQVVWLRLAMADFGVTTALVSIVLSVFMAGLALGSWGGGQLIQRFAERPVRFFVALYAAAELAIGVSGIAVAPLLRSGRSLLAANGSAAEWGSLGYYLASGLWIALILLPFCACMGATFPLTMAAIRGGFRAESPRSFSFLYLANVLGAMAGTIGSAFVFIESLGFSKTLLLAVAGNFTIGIWAAVRSRTPIFSQRLVTNPAAPNREVDSPSRPPGKMVLPLLFASGLSSLGMEVVWTRQFVPFVGPFVYSFATILAIYLAATAAGSRVYRVWAESARGAAAGTAWRTASVLAGCFALLPLLAVDPRLRLPSEYMRVGYGLAPFCGTLGFLTSMLVDHWSGGDPTRAGRAYAVNTIGCIAGPLLAGFVLLPEIGERWTVALLSVPFFAFGFLGLFAGTAGARNQRSFATLAGMAAIAAVLL